MTINGGASWAVASQSYGKSNVQGQSGASGTASADYTSMLQQASETLMSTLDTDKSGTIDKAEFSQAEQALADKTGKSYNDAGSVFGSVDSNNDGAISADELMKALQQSQSQQAQGNGHHHHHKMAATDTSAQATTGSAQASTASEETLSLSKMQSALLQRVMAAYSSNSPASSSTTLATA